MAHQIYYYILPKIGTFILKYVWCYLPDSLEKSLHKIALQFRAEYSEIYTSLAEDTEAFKKKSEKIQQLRTLYTMTDELPVWPLDVKTFRRYLLTVPTPLIGILSGIFKNLLINLLKQQGIKFGT
ncbi:MULTISPECIES: hypothetical protein [unclassified Nostoc]|uniref:hypothetical protein n=1 Tax=unclassified Nostoc TaxID=2593658 RepID=UPI0026143CD1|nr:hypothetical protein [Nostoc sp. S13]MDF5734993.1 hypothetical protein [Nostoc sp. S13]